MTSILAIVGPTATGKSELAMALAEESGSERETWRWRTFSIGGAIGAAFDSVLAATGLLVYSSGVLFAGTAPYWIVAMWALFATTLNVSMGWMR